MKGKSGKIRVWIEVSIYSNIDDVLEVEEGEDPYEVAVRWIEAERESSFPSGWEWIEGEESEDA